MHKEFSTRKTPLLFLIINADISDFLAVEFGVWGASVSSPVGVTARVHMHLDWCRKAWSRDAEFSSQHIVRNQQRKFFFIHYSSWNENMEDIESTKSELLPVDTKSDFGKIDEAINESQVHTQHTSLSIRTAPHMNSHSKVSVSHWCLSFSLVSSENVDSCWLFRI